MNTYPYFPSFDEQIPFLNQFILELAAAYQTKELQSWGELDERVKRFFTPEQTRQLDTLIPGWEKMASYTNGVTQTHVTCVLLGVFLMDELQALSPEEQQLAKWIALFHDLDKFHVKGKKDTMHPFTSAVLAAQILPSLGFPTTDKYNDLIESWSAFTRNAYKKLLLKPNPIPDNKKLPKILEGIDQLVGENSPASLIIKGVLLHVSIDADPNYPTPAPLTDAEIKRFLTPQSFALLKVMMLGDIEGWSLFETEMREQQYRDAYKAFERVQALLSRP